MRARTNGTSIHTKGCICMVSEWHAYVGANAWIHAHTHTSACSWVQTCTCVNLIQVDIPDRVNNWKKLAPKLQTDSGFNPIWMLKWFTRTAEPIRPDILRFLAKPYWASIFKIKHDLYHHHYHIVARRWHNFRLSSSRSRRRRRRHSHIVVANFVIFFTVL